MLWYLLPGVKKDVRHAPTPFGEALRRVRRHRCVLQKQLALDLSVSLSLVSSWETGAKPPPRGEQLRALTAALNLADAEAADLERLSRVSQPIVRVPRGTSAAGYLLLHRLADQLPQLSSKHLSALQGVLELQFEETR